MTRRDFLGTALLTAGGMLTPGCKPSETGRGCRWYKGMLHTHSYVSDGRALPEQAVGAYKTLGYDFMSLTDHNRLSMTEEVWKPIRDQLQGWPPWVYAPYVERARERYPWIKTRLAADGSSEALMTPFAELMKRFNEPGRFLLMPGVEVTRGTGKWKTGRQVHINYINLTDVIPSAKQAGLVQETFSDLSPAKLIRATHEEAELLARASGNPAHVIIVNHPQWPYYDLVPQDLIDNPEVRFFEVCNNGAERDAIPERHACGGYDNDRFWDVVNAFRARAGVPLLLGLASDDTHWYPGTGAKPKETCEGGYAGDGWIRVRADALTPEALFGAMRRGDFYAACGLDLEDVSFDGRTLSVKVPAEKDVACTVRFIVTKRGFDDRIVKTVALEPTEKVPYQREIPLYSESIGMVAKTVQGEKGQTLVARYTLADDDLYVRARVECTRISPYVAWHRETPKHPVHPLHATAWTQPVVRG